MDDRQKVQLPAGTPVQVQLIGGARLADLVIIGSHCVGLDVLIGGRLRTSQPRQLARVPRQRRAGWQTQRLR